MILTIVGGVLFVWLVLDVCANARRRREREDLRHVTGAVPWWGRR